MQKLLKNLLLTTSIVLVGGAVVTPSYAWEWLDTLSDGWNNVKKVKNIATEVYDAGTKVRLPSGGTGVVQKGGEVVSSSGKVIGKVNVPKSSGGGSGTGTPKVSGNGSGSGSGGSGGGTGGTGTSTATPTKSYTMSDVTNTKAGTELGDTGFVKQTDGNFHTAAEKANIDTAKNEISGQRMEGDASKGTEAQAEAEAAKGSVFDHKATIQNVAQYALVILAAALAENDWEETKDVNVKVNLLEQTQGESGDGSVGSVSTLDGTTTADAAASMATLLANNAVNYDPLLSKVVDLSGMTGGLTGTGGSGSVVTSGTQYKRIIKLRREQLFQVYSIAASMIAAGSNAISSRFYDRLSLYIDGLMSTSGTLGALSTINDSERFVMFEMSRGAALSATELGFRGSGTLRELDVLEEESNGS